MRHLKQALNDANCSFSPLAILVCTALGLVACGNSPSPDDVAHPAAETVVHIAPPFPAGSREARSVLKMVNEIEPIKFQSALAHAPVLASAIVNYRAGIDAMAGTVDDRHYETLEELRDLHGLIESDYQVLFSASVDLGYFPHDLEVVFSPAPESESHIAKINALIQNARYSIDIAMFSHSEASTAAALQRAALRGVRVRYLLDDARRGVAAKLEVSDRMERSGVDVRTVQPGIHEKFIVIDANAPTSEPYTTAQVVVSSANLSYASYNLADESTVFSSGNPTLTFALLKHFDQLWSLSADYVVDDQPPQPPQLGATLEAAAESGSPGVDVLFNIENFAVNDADFHLVGRYAIADQIVQAIDGATTSVSITARHLRSRPIAEALLKKAKDRSVTIRVLIDQRDFVSKSLHEQQLAGRETCIAAAGDDAGKIEACNDLGFRYGYALEQEHVSVRYKTYAFDFDRLYTPVLHNNFLIIDNQQVMVGSYNFTWSSEHTLHENTLRISADTFPKVVESFVKKFDALWDLGRAGEFEHALQVVRTSIDVPLVFDSRTNLSPMSLTRGQAGLLRVEIFKACGFKDASDASGPPDGEGDGKDDVHDDAPLTCLRK